MDKIIAGWPEIGDQNAENFVKSIKSARGVYTNATVKIPVVSPDIFAQIHKESRHLKELITLQYFMGTRLKMTQT